MKVLDEIGRPDVSTSRRGADSGDVQLRAGAVLGEAPLMGGELEYGQPVGCLRGVLAEGAAVSAGADQVGVEPTSSVRSSNRMIQPCR